MKSLTNFITEDAYKLSDFKTSKSNKYRSTTKKNGEILLWFKIYTELLVNGPQTKKEVLRKLGLKETSYSTMFAEMAARGIIIYDDKNVISAAPQEDWDLEALSWHELPGAEMMYKQRAAEYFDEKTEGNRTFYKIKPEYADSHFSGTGDIITQDDIDYMNAAAEAVISAVNN